MVNFWSNEKELYESIKSEGIVINKTVWDSIYRCVNDNIAAIGIICQQSLAKNEPISTQEAKNILSYAKEIKYAINPITITPKESLKFNQSQDNIPLNLTIQQLIKHQFGNDIYAIELMLRNAIDPITVLSIPLEITQKILSRAQAIKEYIEKFKEVVQQREEERYRSLYDSFKDGLILTDMEGNLLDINQAYLSMFGYTEKEIKTLSHQQLTPRKWHKREENIIGKLIASKRHSDEYEKEYIQKNGTVFSVSLKIWLVRNKQGEPSGIWAIVRNITERKLAEKEILADLLDSHMVIDKISDGITVSDAQGYFEVFNLRMQDITGYTIDEANQAEDFNILIYPKIEDRQEVFKELSKIAAEKGCHEIETAIQAKDGLKKILLVSTSLIRYKNRNMFLSVWRDITERKELEAKLKSLASHDELTGCFNFRSTMELLEKEIARALRYQTCFSIIMIDIDDFKSKNDTYGHLAGNDILIAFSAVIKNNLRGIDSVGRYGGEEFIVILPETNAEQVLVVIERIRINLKQAKITSPHFDISTKITLEFSAGIAMFPHNAKDLKELIWVADNAMFQAKREGKNRAVLERRKSIRFSPKPGTRMEIVNSSGKENAVISHIADISKEGMLFHSAQDISDKKLLCCIYRPKDEFPFELTCKVKHKEKMENEAYHMGVYFPDISESSKEKLSECIKPPS